LAQQALRYTGRGALETAVRVDDSFRKIIVFVGLKRGPNFIAYGTGFITVNFIEDVGFQTVVTARHVIDKVRLHGGGTLARGRKSE
jgi:hypothetical protein